MELVIGKLNVYLQGWKHYFGLTNTESQFKSLDSWIRRRLRCYKLKQRKQSSSIVSMLKALGLPDNEARQLGSSGKGLWRLSMTPALHRTLNLAWFKSQGLMSLAAP